ncbi:MAG: CHAT domain-containing protein [Phyllobacteriaceae bacterium]|jgi:hypothetical protein|nr:CHAT domain-containing protein [Phyllobacteriaceae bacterium]
MLNVQVLNGDLTHAKGSVCVLGLYAQIAPNVAFQSVDRVLSGKIYEQYVAGMLDGTLGAVNTCVAGQPLGMEQIYIVGLGDFDALRTRHLREVAQSIVEKCMEHEVETLLTVPLGLGSGHSMDGVCTHYLVGLIEAIISRSPSTITTLKICELDQANCDAIAAQLGAWNAMPFAVTSGKVTERSIAKSQWQRPTDVTYVRIRIGDEAEGRSGLLEVDTEILPPDGRPVKMLPKTVTRSELDGILRELGNRGELTTALGTRLANLVFDGATSGLLAETQRSAVHAIVVQHDREASVLPFEMLSLPTLTFPASSRPFSREFLGQTIVSRQSPHRLREGPLKVLLVANPTDDLPYAEVEATRLIKLAGQSPDIEVEPLWDATRGCFFDHLESGTYDVVHYCGHAFFNPIVPQHSGLKLSDGLLTGADAAMIHDPPRMIFFNACEAGRMRRGPAARTEVEATVDRRVERNAGLAEAFLTNGVAHLLGTHWPVGDRAAEVFASEFYRRLFAGEEIGIAIMRARQQVFGMDSVDWANYIHFGDPIDRVR